MLLDTDNPEREKTDESLRTERDNTDLALENLQTRVERSADAIIAQAREQADAVLDMARDIAEEKLDAADAPIEARNAVASEEAREDNVLRQERAAADEILQREREERARTLISLLPVEREKTDNFLQSERARSDDSVAQRDDFLGIVSHDLRNLLGGVSMNARLLVTQASDSEEGKRTVAAMGRIQSYIVRMDRLVGDLVDVVSIDAGKLSLHTKPCDVTVLVTEAIDAFGHAAQEGGISLLAETGKDPLSAAFDHDRMFQVLANLITNAIKFTAPGGVVKVRSEAAGEEVRLSVLDTGTGIAEDLLDTVFERFWQADEHATQGHGLGLYISRRIVDAHGGRIWVESKPGLGSAFHFTIPLIDKGHR